MVRNLSTKHQNRQESHFIFCNRTDHTEDMEIFKRMVAFLDFFERKLDIIKKLSIKISSIFGMVDDRSLRYVVKVSTTWKGISVYEQERRKPRGTKLNIARCLPVQHYSIANQTMTFDMNELVVLYSRISIVFL